VCKNKRQNKKLSYDNSNKRLSLCVWRAFIQVI